MEPPVRLELTTFALQERRSTNSAKDASARSKQFSAQAFLAHFIMPEARAKMPLSYTVVIELL